MVSGVIVKVVNRLNIDQEVSTIYIYTDWQKLFYLGWPALINYYRLQSIL